MSWNFNNSLSGSGSGSSLGNLHGGYSFAPTYTSNSGTSVTPSFSRGGNISSLNTSSGVNTYGATVSQPISNSTSVFAGGHVSSNGHSGVSAGIKMNF